MIGALVTILIHRKALVMWDEPRPTDWIAEMLAAALVVVVMGIYFGWCSGGVKL